MFRNLFKKQYTPRIDAKGVLLFCTEDNYSRSSTIGDVSSDFSDKSIVIIWTVLSSFPSWPSDSDHKRMTCPY